MPRTLNYQHEPDEHSLEDRAANTTAWTLGLILFPLAIGFVAGLVGGMDSGPASTFIGVLSGVVWLAALVNGIVGVVRCRAWKKSGTNDVAAADVLTLINAFPAGMVLTMAFIAA